MESQNLLVEGWAVLPADERGWYRVGSVRRAAGRLIGRKRPAVRVVVVLLFQRCGLTAAGEQQQHRREEAAQEEVQRRLQEEAAQEEVPAPRSCSTAAGAARCRRRDPSQPLRPRGGHRHWGQAMGARARILGWF